MGVSLWGESPLYEIGSLKEPSIPNGAVPIEKARGEDNCGRATNRGKEVGANPSIASGVGLRQGQENNVPAIVVFW